MFETPKVRTRRKLQKRKLRKTRHLLFTSHTSLIMPRHSERASRIQQLKGWIVRHLHRQQKKSSTVLFVHHYDVTDVKFTMPPFVHHLYQRLKKLTSSRYLHERPHEKPRLADHASV